MNRETLLARRPTTEVKDGEDVVAIIRKLTANEFQTVTSKEFQGEENALKLMRYLVCRSTVDDEKKQVFKNDEADTVVAEEMSFADLKLIAEAAIKFNGLDAPAESAKND